MCDNFTENLTSQYRYPCRYRKKCQMSVNILLGSIWKKWYRFTLNKNRMCKQAFTNTRSFGLDPRFSTTLFLAFVKADCTCICVGLNSNWKHTGLLLQGTQLQKDLKKDEADIISKQKQLKKAKQDYTSLQKQLKAELKGFQVRRYGLERILTRFTLIARHFDLGQGEIWRKVQCLFGLFG